MTTPSPNDDFLAQWNEGNLSDDELRTLVSESDFEKLLKIRSGIQLHQHLEAPLDHTLDSIKERIRLEEGKTSNTKTIPLFYKMSIAIAASIALFFGIRGFISDTLVTESSDFGEQRTISLLDGSTVILNAKSDLTYDESDWNSKREVFVNGEAFFKVKEGSTFTVNTDNGSITVLGTHFNVNTFNDFFETVCYKGKVKVVTHKKEFVILPKQSVRNHRGNIISEVVEVDTEIPTWLLGTSSFRQVPLTHVLRELENQFNVQLDHSDVDSAIIFTCDFVHGNLETALKSVFDSLEIRYSISGNNIKLSKQN